MIIDSHGHIFPHLDGPSGYASRAEQRRRLQQVIARDSTMPVRRKRNAAIVAAPTLWDPHDVTERGAWDVDFRATTMGRIEWTHGGEDYYLESGLLTSPSGTRTIPGSPRRAWR